jgi:hypothetical protein
MFPLWEYLDFWRWQAERLASGETNMAATACALVESSRNSRRVAEL